MAKGVVNTNSHRQTRQLYTNVDKFTMQTFKAIMFNNKPFDCVTMIHWH